MSSSDLILCTGGARLPCSCPRCAPPLIADSRPVLPVISATREIASMQLALGNISAEVQRLHAANCQLIYDLKAARAACAALLARNTDLEAESKAGRQRELIWRDEERARDLL